MIKISEKEVRLVEHLELQIIVLEKEWINYEKEFFHDWNKVFSSMKAGEMKTKLLTSLKAERHEKKDFEKIWHSTIALFRKSADFVSKGRKKQIEKLYYEIENLKKEVLALEHLESKTLAFLQNNNHKLQQVFDSIYGPGYYSEILENYKLRFIILDILYKEYEMVSEIIKEFN